MKFKIICLIFTIVFNVFYTQNNEFLGKDKKKEKSHFIYTKPIITGINCFDGNIDSLVFDSLVCGLNFQTGPHYESTKRDIINWRKKVKDTFLAIKSLQEKDLYLDSICVVFTSKLLNEIIPYWYGTEWDFDGHTSTPKNGKIACGYFVSTTLYHMGLKLNRYKLAQQDPLHEAKSIAMADQNLTTYHVDDQNTMLEMLKEISDGLYFVGLDYHVGYLYKKDNVNYFIHSNFIEDKVMIELAESSLAFNSEMYYLSRISKNRELMVKWINNLTINIESNN